MTKEHCQPSEVGFDFTENERLFSRVTDKRLKHIIFDKQTTIHQATLSENNFGEYLFITVSRPKGQGREAITFWGYGYHTERERWLIDDWFWHQSHQFLIKRQKTVSKPEVETILQNRRDEISPYAQKSEQTRRGQLFEMLADLTDEDGAMSEMEDLGRLFGAVFDDFE